jgi:hypothetical protein
MATLANQPMTAGGNASGWLLRASARLLAVSVWISGALFGAYILLFFGGLALGGDAARWNEALPRLHDPAAPYATLAIGAHFATGGILLLLGPIQLIGAIRERMPAVHRWLGRLYVLAAATAGAGGLSYILVQGTIGGPVMSLGFGLYGALGFVTALLTFARGYARQIEAHRAWAIRLFALVTGSWLYRIEYAFWFLLFGRLGHTAEFGGWFDHVMTFFFYLPNLFVAELFLRARRAPEGSPLRIAGSAVLLAAAGLVILATWFFTTKFWGPGMLEGVAALSAGG